ncbi:MAG TPA: DUF5666 domain-containing protein [Steroidobacteraceae bacterium]
MSVRNLTRLHRPVWLLAASAAATFIIGADYSSAGIQGTGRMALLSFGRIDGAGNTISVNGVDYSLSQAQILIDGKAATPAQLKVGQIVTIQGSSKGATSGDANSVTFTADVAGPVTQLDVAGGTFTVLGQQVKVDADTVFAETMQPAGIGALSVGTGVEVSAFRTASGELLASRVDLQAAGAPLMVRGAVEALNADARTFQINDLTIAYTQSRVHGSLANASTATVTSGEAPSAGTLQAATVDVSNGVQGAAAGVSGQIQGLITSLNSASSFYVGDQRVVTNSETHFALQRKTLQANLAVQIKGTFDSSGALVAKQVYGDPKTP